MANIRLVNLVSLHKVGLGTARQIRIREVTTMQLSTAELDGKVYFLIREVEHRFIPVLQMCYYQPDDKGFYKAYPADYPNIELIRENFVRNGIEMFHQLGYFKPIPWQLGLKEFIRRVQGSGISWWLTGSCAVCLRGIALKPHDVDIMVDSRDIPKIMELFRDDIFEPIVDTQGWVTKEFGVLYLGCRVDIASDPAACLDDPLPVDCGPYAKAHLERIIWEGYSVLVPPLELSLAVNKKRERWDRVKLIEEHLTERDKEV